MHEEFQALVELPTAENYRLVRQAVLALPEYDPLARDVARLARLCGAGKWSAARRLADEALPALALSPRLHYWSAVAAAAVEDDADAELERFLLGACLEGVLGTGAGTRERPFLVTHLSDVADVLTALRHDPCGQELRATPDGWADVVTTLAGREVWFDVTDLLCGDSRPGRRKLLARHAARLPGDMPRFDRHLWAGGPSAPNW